MKVLYFLIIYKNPEIVERIVTSLQSERSLFLIHVDKNSKLDFSRLRRYSNVHFTSFRFPTPWGGPELALAVYEGLKEIQSCNWDYVCLLSESDYPVKRPEYIADFLNVSQKDHILINPLPCNNPLEIPGGHWLEGGRRRTECYALRLTPKQIATIEPNRFDIGNLRQIAKTLRYKPNKIFNALNILFAYPKRLKTTDVLCGGHQWFFLTRKTTDVIIKYCDSHPEFLEDSKNTQCLDEIFFPTIVNQVVEDKSLISRNILRYISWENNGSSSPKDITLEESDIIDQCIENPGILFIRKISDEQICDYVDERLGHHNISF